MYKLLPILIILISWQIFSYFVSPLFLVSPIEVLISIITNFSELTFWQGLSFTLFKTILGLSLGIFFGILIGLVLSLSKFFKFSYQLIFDFLRSIPVVAIYPLFILFLGFNDLSKIAVIAWGSSFLVALNTFYGVQFGSKIRLQSMQLLGCNGLSLIQKVILPQASPQIMAGIRLATSYSLVISLVTEMYFGSNNGLGKSLIDAQINYEIAQVYALIVVCGLIGFVCSKLILQLEKKILFWV